MLEEEEINTLRIADEVVILAESQEYFEAITNDTNVVLDTGVQHE